MSENRPVDSPLPCEGLIVSNQMDKRNYAYDTVEDETQCDKMIQASRRAESLPLKYYMPL
jgi:hypothetical protein